jgi:hypothetical protein
LAINDREHLQKRGQTLFDLLKVKRPIKAQDGLAGIPAPGRLPGKMVQGIEYPVNPA